MKRSVFLPVSFLSLWPVLLIACEGGSCPTDQTSDRISACSPESRAFLDAALKSPKDYMDLEKSKVPFLELFRGVAAILTPDDLAPALRIIVQLLDQGRKAFSKQLVREAVRQAEVAFAEHPELPADAAARGVLKEKLELCIKFFTEQALVPTNE